MDIEQQLQMKSKMSPTGRLASIGGKKTLEISPIMEEDTVEETTNSNSNNNIPLDTKIQTTNKVPNSPSNEVANDSKGPKMGDSTLTFGKIKIVSKRKNNGEPSMLSSLPIRSLMDTGLKRSGSGNVDDVRSGVHMRKLSVNTEYPLTYNVKADSRYWKNSSINNNNRFGIRSGNGNADDSDNDNDADIGLQTPFVDDNRVNMTQAKETDEKKEGKEQPGEKDGKEQQITNGQSQDANKPTLTSSPSRSDKRRPSIANSTTTNVSADVFYEGTQGEATPAPSFLRANGGGISDSESEKQIQDPQQKPQVSNGDRTPTTSVAQRQGRATPPGDSDAAKASAPFSTSSSIRTLQSNLEGDKEDDATGKRGKHSESDSMVDVQGRLSHARSPIAVQEVDFSQQGSKRQDTTDDREGVFSKVPSLISPSHGKGFAAGAADSNTDNRDSSGIGDTDGDSNGSGNVQIDNVHSIEAKIRLRRSSSPARPHIPAKSSPLRENSANLATAGEATTTSTIKTRKQGSLPNLRRATNLVTAVGTNLPTIPATKSFGPGSLRRDTQSGNTLGTGQQTTRRVHSVPLQRDTRYMASNGARIDNNRISNRHIKQIDTPRKPLYVPAVLRNVLETNITSEEISAAAGSNHHARHIYNNSNNSRSERPFLLARDPIEEVDENLPNSSARTVQGLRYNADSLTPGIKKNVTDWQPTTGSDAYLVTDTSLAVDSSLLNPQIRDNTQSSIHSTVSSLYETYKQKFKKILGYDTSDIRGFPTAEEPRRDHWVPDEERTHCHKCKVQFGVLQRKHHCRHCGEIFCANDVKNMVYLDLNANFSPLRQFGGSVLVKVCDDCMQANEQFMKDLRMKKLKRFEQQQQKEQQLKQSGEEYGNQKWNGEGVGSRGRKESMIGSVPVDWNWSSF